MKSIFTILFLLVVLMQIMDWQNLPEQVTVHFGSGGHPNGWADKDSYLLMQLGFYVFLFLMFYLSPELIFRVPGRWVNLPNKNYWLKPENESVTRHKISNAMSEMGMIVFLFFGYLEHLSKKANLSSPANLDEPRFFMAMVVFFFLVIVWTMRFNTTFRIPKNPLQSHDRC